VCCQCCILSVLYHCSQVACVVSVVYCQCCITVVRWRVLSVLYIVSVVSLSSGGVCCQCCILSVLYHCRQVTCVVSVVYCQCCITALRTSGHRHASTHCIDVSHDSDVSVRLRCWRGLLDVVSRARTGRGRVGVLLSTRPSREVLLRSRLSSCDSRAASAAACNSELTDDRRRPAIVDVLLILLPSSTTNSLQPTTNS